MYGQGNYAQFGQGSQRPMPHFQQRPVATPHPPFHQGPQASQYSLLQQGPPSIPPHVSHSTPPAHQRAPPPPVQQGPPVQVPTTGMLNAGQSHLPPTMPQQVRGSTSVAHPYQPIQQDSQWTRNMHRTPQPVPPYLGPPPSGPSRPEMFRPSLPPRALPTLPSQGQSPYKGPIYLPQPGSVQVSQQILPPPPPPPPVSSFFAPAPFGSFVHSAHEHSNVLPMGPMPPPPPPSSPPPLPPSPPPPTSPLPTFGTVSSTSLLTVSDLFHNSESGPMANHSGLEVMDSDSKVAVSSQIRDDAPVIDDYKTPEGRTSCELGLPRKEDLSSVEGSKSDLPPPPPKPAEEKVVQKIEVLCHFIAKNGPGFEDMARQKEYANPEFEFLFGGKPGSEAAVAHEYFEWMKKKCKLAFKFQNEHNDSVLRPSGIDTSTRTDYSTDAAVSHSPPDSDMDMEDDITQPDEEQQVCTSFEGLNHEAVLLPKELDSPVKHNESVSSGLTGQEKGSKLLLDHGHLTRGRSLPKVDSPVTNSAGAAECPSDSNVEKFPVPPLEDLGQLNNSAATTGSGSGKLSGELVNGASPFRLIQDYASDDSLEDDDKPCLEDASPVKASPSSAAAATSLHGDIGSNLQTNAGSMSLSSFDVAYGTSSESIVACSQSMPLNAVEVSPESLRTARETNLETNVTSFATVTTKEIFGNEENIVKATSLEALQLKVVFDSVRNSTPQSGKTQSQKEAIKFAPTLPKVDEFGRLLREGASDSDSDGSQSHYTGRRGKRRRSWSRSRSPHGRRRSPQRRREKRSWSRSWSPKKRRSRSRSPTYKRGGDFGGEKMKRDKGQLPLCFDFLRGRCHRGAFCRYMHHDSNKSDVARRDRSKQQHAEIPHISRTSDFHEENKNTLSERSVHEVDLAGSSFSAFKDGHRNGGEKLISMQDATPSILDQDDKSLVVRQAKSQSSRELTAIMQDSRDMKEEKLESTTGLPDNENRLTDIGTPMAPVDTSHGISSLGGNCVILHSQANLSLPGLQNADQQSLHVEGCSTSDSLQFQTSTSFHHQLPVSEQQLNKISLVEPYPGSNSNSQSFSSQSVDFPDHHLQLPPSLPSLSQGTSIPPPAPQLPREYNLASKFSSLSPSVGNFPPFQGQLQNLYSHSIVPPNSSWPLPPPPLLPPRPPFVNNATANASPAMQGVPLFQFQHNQLPPRNDFTSQTFARPYPPELPANSQVGEFQHHSSYPVTQLQDPHRPSLNREDLKPKTLPTSNPPRQSFGGTSFVGEDHFSRFPVPGLNLPNYGQGNIHSQPVPSLNPRTMQSFPSDNLPSGGFFTSSSQNHLYSQPQQITVSQGDYGNVQSTMPRYTSDLDKSQPSHLSDSGGSRIPNHYNPYASTFDRPISSKISSSVIKQEKDMLCSNLDDDAPYSASHFPVDRHAVGSKLITFSPKREPVDIPRLGSDQYDPLFDSIDLFSNSFKKFDHGLEHESIDDSIRLRLKGHKPLDVLEKDGVLAETTSVRSENDEYGETADAEVGDVENESASNALDATNTSAGEVEIDQVKMPGKRRKSKDSRSMKLFKGALADFVKEVLKPSWRQGNMSKEAFKTIVKKTVDKVSAAMKSHQIPKSQAKINQYIDSSQRKLTKLVMGYVQKYVKV